MPFAMLENGKMKTCVGLKYYVNIARGLESGKMHIEWLFQPLRPRYGLVLFTQHLFLYRQENTKHGIEKWGGKQETLLAGQRLNNIFEEVSFSLWT